MQSLAVQALFAFTNDFFQHGASAENRNGAGWDFDGLASLWVAASASFALSGGEGPKTYELNAFAFFDVLFNSGHESGQPTLTVCFGAVGLFGEAFDQFCAIHKNSFSFSTKNKNVNE